MASVRKIISVKISEHPKRKGWPRVQCKSHIVCKISRGGLVWDWSKRGPRSSSIRWVNFYSLPEVSPIYARPYLKILGDE